MELANEIFKLVAVGIVSGLFSAYLANRKHRSQKWWELKVSSYQQLIEALSDLIYYFDTNYIAETEQREYSEEFKIKLSKFWDEGYHKVRKYSDSGAFVFSKEVNDSLLEFTKTNSERPDTYFEYLDNNLFIAKKCLKTITTAAKKDLKI